MATLAAPARRRRRPASRRRRARVPPCRALPAPAPRAPRSGRDPPARLAGGEAAVGAAQVHRAGRAKCREARMHLGRQRPRHGARGQRRRPERRLGVPLRQGFGNGERVPEHGRRAFALDPERRDRPGAAELLGQHGADVRRVEPPDPHRYRDPEPGEREPPAQGPARVGAVADREDIGHAAPPAPRLFHAPGRAVKADNSVRPSRYRYHSLSESPRSSVG